MAEQARADIKAEKDRAARITEDDLDFLVATKEPAELCRYFTTFPPVSSIIAEKAAGLGNLRIDSTRY